MAETEIEAIGLHQLKGVPLEWRLLSFLVDLAVLCLIAYVLILPLEKSYLSICFAMLVLWMYFAFCESSSLRGTLGKLLCGLAVVDLEGKQLDLSQATGRHFCRKFSYCGLGGLGTLAVPFSSRKQALHDWASQSIVVLRSELRQP